MFASGSTLCRNPNDKQLGHYLITTLAKVCQAMTPEFKPYLPVVMPSLLTTADAKAALSLYCEFIPLLILAFIHLQYKSNG
jgi:hypothetical protein